MIHRADLDGPLWPDLRCLTGGDQPGTAHAGEKGSGNQYHCLTPSKSGASSCRLPGLLSDICSPVTHFSFLIRIQNETLFTIPRSLQNALCSFT